MTDREKVIKAAEHCIENAEGSCKGCPYEKTRCSIDFNTDVLALLQEKPEIVRCKDCKYRGRTDRCVLAKCAETMGEQVFMLDNDGNWFCADGVEKTETERKQTMTLSEYQQKAMRTSSTKLTSSEHLMNGCLGLAGEAGECCDLLKKSRFQDGREIREKLLDELGDVLWYVAETASAIGYTLDDVAEHNIKKLMDRYPEGFDPERSLHRNE